MTGENYMMQSLIHNFCWSPNIIRKIKSWRLELGELCSLRRRNKKRVQCAVGELEGKKPLGRPGYGLECKIRMDLNKMK